MSDVNNESLRWHAVVTYRSRNGPIEIDLYFEELDGLGDLIERGPDWNALVDIVITLNIVRAVYPGDTIEAAAER